MQNRRDRVTQEDRRILRSVADGSAPGFAIFCEEILPDLRAFVVSKCVELGIPKDLSQDFVHDAIIKAIEFLRKRPMVTVHRGWLLTIAHNAMIDWLRKRKTAPQSLDIQVDVRDQNRLKGNEHLDIELEQVARAFHNLSKNDRMMLQLVLIDAAETAAISRKLNITKWTVYKRYERALDRLREAVKVASQNSKPGQ